MLCCRLMAVALFLFCSMPLFAQRQDILLNDNWKFRFSHQVQKGSEIRVDLPHTWNAQDALSGKIDYKRGIGNYEKKLFIRPEWQGKRLFLRFEGANSIADVFINRRHIGEHRGGYGAFVFEITGEVNYGKENSILVRVNNGEQLDVMPLVGDFNFYGGIYRDVHLLITDEACISPLNYASPGVRLIQDSVSHQYAKVRAVVDLANGNNAGQEVELGVRLLDGQKVVAQQKQTLTLAGNAALQQELTFEINNPHLWNGRQDPFLYQAEVSLSRGGQLVDCVTQPLGLRYYRIDPDKGFFLNGKHLPLHGVCRHQDRSEVGNALRPQHHEEDVALMLEMGVNAVRLAHYPQATYFYDLMDKNGIIVWAEIPFIGPGGYDDKGFVNLPSFRANGKEQLKELIRRAHELGLAVIMDLVHAHYVKNLNEGINELDGTDHLYSLPGTAGEQPYWDSKTFDYGKEQVRHFLLSNVKYWLDEFHFDGYRFDGVTSMIYHHHGHTDFSRREQYFDAGVNEHALTYLTLANTLVHDFRPRAVTIAEEVSGMPGIAVPTADGGVGFDYRLGMAIPDFWIRQLKEVPDEKWDIHAIWHVLTDRLPGIKTVAYAESHDQALVGDQTLAFRLMGKEMYEHMDRASQSPVIDRGMALHKMIRLVTISAGGDAYLNFMGNEFGHPEWIDFPREGNGWSYAYARRQWSLADNGLLRYAQLGEFDRAMIALVKKYGILRDGYPYNLQMDTQNQTMAFSHGDLLFVFNWHPSASIPNYEVRVRVPGRYRPILSTDERRFGGTERTDMRGQHFSYPVQGDELPRIRIYNTSRTATVFLREE